jgi:osmotically-inducible protein OsmY
MRSDYGERTPSYNEAYRPNERRSDFGGYGGGNFGNYDYDRGARSGFSQENYGTRGGSTSRGGFDQDWRVDQNWRDRDYQGGGGQGAYGGPQGINNEMARRGYPEEWNRGSSGYGQDFSGRDEWGSSSQSRSGGGYFESPSRGDTSGMNYRGGFDDRSGYGSRSGTERGWSDRSGQGQGGQWQGNQGMGRNYGNSDDQGYRSRSNFAEGSYGSGFYEGNRSGREFNQPSFEENWRGAGYGDFDRFGNSGNFGMGGPHAGKGPKGWQRSDERIREDVCDRLEQHAHLDASELEVEVHNGEVTLRGSVDERRQKRLAEDLVESITGVKDVHNELRVHDHDEHMRSMGSGFKSDSTGSSTTSGHASTSSASASNNEKVGTH